MSPLESRFWADQVAGEIVAKRSDFVFATGITPSGDIHIGNLREILTADAVVRVLREMGKSVMFYYIGDTYDPLRRVYPFLDEAEYSQYVGRPLSDIPAPDGVHKSYAEQFLSPFLGAVTELDVGIEVVLADQMYKEGRYVQSIIRALECADKIREILKEETGREMERTWSPFNSICNSCRRLTETQVTGFDAARAEVEYSCACGDRGKASMRGGGKLTWRVDWAARWHILGVTVEPFGKDHASRGGSYDTGVRIAREVFGCEPPHPIVYEWISLKGAGDMSSSKGNVISVHEMLKVVPPDILKYWILRNKPNRSVVFDPGLPLLRIVDEYDDPESKDRDDRAATLSRVPGSLPLGVPFRHIVSLVQTSGGDLAKISEILLRTGYKVEDEARLASRVAYAKGWLERFAPEEVKFELARELPREAAALSPAQRRALALLSQRLEPGMGADRVHSTVYAVAEESGIGAAEVFESIYLSLLGKPRGPRAGFFLSSLDAEFVRRRFYEAAEACSAAGGA